MTIFDRRAAKRLYVDARERGAVLGSPEQWLNVYRRCEAAPAGDFVECGVHKGGYSLLLSRYGRKQWMFDSWDGIPEAYYEKTKGYRVKGPSAKGVMPECLDNFAALGCLAENQTFVRGWFAETLRKYSGDIAVLIVDGDLYSSTLDCLNALYSKVVPGGFVIVDDLPLDGCWDAVMEFREREGVTAQMFGNDDELLVRDRDLYGPSAGGWWRVDG